MTRKTNQRLKLSDIGISEAAMKQILVAGGEDLAVRIFRRVQRDWRKHDKPPGLVQVLRLQAAGQEINVVFPLPGIGGAAILTPDEAERTRQAILTGVPDQIRLSRVKVA